jgi:uncharacterized protein
MSQYKIIFTGPEGAGKTTAIEAISDVLPINTDESITNRSKAKNTTATVTTAYGILNLEGGDKIHLYETPVQGQSDLERNIIVKGGIGLVLLLDNTRADPFKDMQFFLKAFGKFIEETHVAIGITRTDINNKPAIAGFHALLKPSDLRPPIFEIDARVKGDVSLLLQSLLYSLNPEIAY